MAERADADDDRRIHAGVSGDPRGQKAREQEVIERWLMSSVRGIPEYIRSDNGPEFVAKELRQWLAKVGPERCTSSREVHGRTATAKASTESCGTNA